MTTHGLGFPFLSDENVLELNILKTIKIYTLSELIICELHLNKAVTKQY